MAKAYKPNTPFNVPFRLLIPEYRTVKGSTKKLPAKDAGLIWCSFKTFGGTEIKTDAGIVIEDTATVETWYRPDIKANCTLQSAEDASTRYEVLGTPENINMRNQFLKFKVRRIRGGA